MGAVNGRPVPFPAVVMAMICVHRYVRRVAWPLRPPAGSRALTVMVTLRTRCPIAASVLPVGSSP